MALGTHEEGFKCSDLVVVGEELTVPDGVVRVLGNQGLQPPVLLIVLRNNVQVSLRAHRGEGHQCVLNHA